MKFPVIVRHRREKATIYGKSANYAFYRLGYYVAGQRCVRSFKTYGEAKTEAERIVRQLAEGSQAAALSGPQSRDALAAMQRLDALRQSTGRRVSLLAAVSEFAEASAKLQGRNLGEVVEGYLNTVASVKRKEITEAVEEFIAIRKPLTEAQAGKRAQLSKNYAYLVGLWLRDFAKTFPSNAVCDLSKEHLNLFMRKHGTHAPKSRNHYRGAVKMFLTWCVKRDYLSPAHRLFEADSMATEAADMPELEYYRPEELRAMLEGVGENPEFKELLPVIVLGGLAGLRLEETLRLEWADIWRVPGHVEIKAQKAKTRSRRLVEICPALAAWLETYREFDGPIFAKSKDTFHATFASLRESLEIPARRNGFRHGFCTYHFALYSNENLTAAQAGNSPAMIHQHYKGLATRAEAEKWFNVQPNRAANIVPLTAKTAANP
jgi:integrase